MRIDYDKPEKASGSDILDALTKHVKDTKKEISGVHKMVIQIDGTEKAISDLTELNSAIEKYEGIVSKNGNAKRMVKYFGTQEKMVSNLRSSWNSLVKDMQNGKVNPNDLSHSKTATSFLRNANALEAAYGSDAINSATNSEMKKMLSEIRNVSSLSEKEYSMSVSRFKEVLPLLREIHDLASNNGIEESAIQDIYKKLGLDKTDEIAKNSKELLEAGDLYEQAMKKFSSAGSSTGSGSASGAEKAAEAVEEAAKKTQEAAKKYKEATKEMLEADLKASHKKQKVSFDDFYEFDYTNDRTIKNISQKIKELASWKDLALSEIERYNNKLANGETQKTLPSGRTIDYEKSLQEQIRLYHTYTDQIEFLQDELQKASLEFNPGDSWGADEINVLIQLLQNLVKTIQDVSKAFGNIDDEAGITPLLSQLSTIGDTINNAFNTGNVDKFTSSLEEMSGAFDQIISKLNQISTKEAVYNISVQKGDTGLGTDSVAEQEWTREYQKMLNAYNRIFDIAKKNGLNNQEAISSLYNSKDVTDALYGVDALSKYNLSGIQASSNLRDRIKAMVEFFNYLNMAQKEIAEADAWDKAHGYTTEDNNVKQFLNETARYMRNSDAVTGSYRTVEERVNRRLNKRNAQDINLDQIQKDLQNQEDEATELSTIIEKLETSFKELQNVFKQGFGISDDTESVNYLEKLSAKMEEVASTAKELSEALSGAMNKSGKEVVDGGVKEKVQEALDEGSVYPIKVGLDPTTSLSDQVQEALSSGDYKIKVKGELAEETETQKTVGTQTEQHHSVSRERADGSIVTDSKTTTSNPTPTPTPSLSANTIGNSADGARGSVQALTGDVQKLGSALTEAGAEAGKVNANLAKAQEYDSDEMARRAKLIQEEENNYSNSLTNANIKSIQRMYDSHDNLVQSVITTVKKLENEDGKILEQLDHYQIKWDGKGNALYGSRMTSDDYQKYFGASDQGALEEAIRQNREYEEREKAYQEERARLIAEGKRQEREQSSRDSSWTEMERKKEVEEAKELEQIEQQRLKTIEKRKADEKKAQETQNKYINKAQEEAWRESEKQRQKQEEANNKQERERLRAQNSAAEEERRNNEERIKNNESFIKRWEDSQTTTPKGAVQSYSKTYEQNIAAIKNMKKNAEEAKEAMREVFKMMRSGDITRDQYSSALDIFRDQKSSIRGDAISAEYDKITAAAKEYYNARTTMNELEAKRIGTENTENDVALTQEWAEAVNRLTIAFQNAADARKMLEAIKDDISSELYDKASKALDSGDLGSAKSRDNIVAKQKDYQKKQEEQQAKDLKNDISAQEKIIKDALDAQTRLNEVRAKVIKGENVSEYAKSSAETAAKTTADQAAQAWEHLKTVLDETSDEYKRLEALFEQSKVGSDKSWENIQKARDAAEKQAAKEKKSAYVSELNAYDRDRNAYQKLKQKELSGATLSLSEAQQMEQALNRIKQAEEQWDSSKSEGISLSERQLRIEEELVNAAKERAAGGNLTEQILEQNAAQQEAIKLRDALKKKIVNMYDQTEWRADPEQWTKDVGDLEERINSIDPTVVKTKEQLDELRKSYREIAQDRQKLAKGAEQQPIGTDWQNSARANLYKWMDQNKMAAKAFREELESLDDAINEVGSKGGAEQWNSDFQRIQGQAADKGLIGKSLGDRFRDQFKNTMTSLATYYLSFQDFIRYGREAVRVVTDLDTQLTEMRKVSNESLQTLQNYQIESFDIADRVGTTASQIQSSTADWMRLGEDLQEAKKSAEQSTLLLNVSEFSDIDAATKSLTSMSQAYKELEKSEIIDKLNNIGNNFSISTSELAESLQKSAGTLKVTGDSLDEAIALTVAGNQVLQNPDIVGQSLKTISLRLSGTSVKDMQEAGEEIDGLITTQSKLRQVIMDATKVASNNYKGFDILNDDGSYKTTYERLLGIAEVFKEIGEEDKKLGTNRQSFLLETIANGLLWYVEIHMRNIFNCR